MPTRSAPVHDGRAAKTLGIGGATGRQSPLTPPAWSPHRPWDGPSSSLFGTNEDGPSRAG